MNTMALTKLTAKEIDKKTREHIHLIYQLLNDLLNRVTKAEKPNHQLATAIHQTAAHLQRADYELTYGAQSIAVNRQKKETLA